MQISSSTRQDIIDAIRIQEANWAGKLDEVAFLNRIFPLGEMPSTDRRFSDAAGDIWQHRVNNPEDWDNDWIFNDSRFGLASCDDELFLRFLCEMIHPVVRSDKQEVETLLQLFNEILARDGFEITERARIAGRPVFTARLKLSGTPPSISSVKQLAEGFNEEYLSQQIIRLETSVSHDPSLAIGTAKELVETCCKTILQELGVTVDDNIEMGKLVKETCKALKLTPDDIPNEVKAAETIKRLLSNLATVTQSLAELRNLYGTGHGKAAKTRGLRSRHAKLAVGAATTLVIFLFETHRERQVSEGTKEND